MDASVLSRDGQAWGRNKFCSRWELRNYQECDLRHMGLKIPSDILCGDTEAALGSTTLDRSQRKDLDL